MFTGNFWIILLVLAILYIICKNQNEEYYDENANYNLCGSVCLMLNKDDCETKCNNCKWCYSGKRCVSRYQSCD